MKKLLRLLLWVLVVGSTFSYAMFQGGYTAWFLFTASLILCVYEGLSYQFSARKLDVIRKLSSQRLTAGATLTVQVEVILHGRFPVSWMWIEDQIPKKLLLHSTPARDLYYPWFNKKQALHYRITQIPRGKYVFTDLNIHTGDAFGLTRRTSLHRQIEEITVYPRVLTLPYWPSTNQFSSGNATAQSRNVNETAHVIGVREYVSGDRLSRIHWPATARTGALKTKEFELHVSNDLLFVLNRCEADYAKLAASVFEWIVTLVTSLAQYSVQKGFGTGLASYGKERFWVPINRGIEQYGRILEHMAVVQANGIETLSQTLLQVTPDLKQGTTLVLATPTLHTDLLNMIGILAHRKTRTELFLVTAFRKLTPSETHAIEKLTLLGTRVCVINDEQDLLEQMQRGTSYVAGT